MKSKLLIALLFFSIASCKKDKNTDIPLSKGVYIINEGNFNFGNGEISFYNPEIKQVSHNLFSTVNGYSLGDVVQSMYIKDSIGFIVVNNSDKVEMVKVPSFESIRTITIPNSSPRYFLALNDSIGYVSDIYSNSIHVVNFQNGSVVTEIAVPQYTEHLVKVDGYVFAEGKRILSNPSSKGSLMRINSITHTYIDKKEFAGDAGGLVKDKNNHVWIAVDENASLNVPASLKCFDKNFNTVTDFSFQSYGQHPRNLCIDGKGETLYYISNDVYYCPNATTGVVPFTFATSEGRNFYGMAIDPATDEVYLSDALDYVQQSRIYRYTKNKEFVHSFTAGVISGDFAFNHD